MTTICTSFHLGNFRLGSRAECSSSTFQLSPETASDSSARPPQARPSWGAHGLFGDQKLSAETQVAARGLPGQLTNSGQEGWSEFPSPLPESHGRVQGDRTAAHSRGLRCLC